MGVVTLCEDFEPETTVVSNLFIDEYMKDANDAQIKIYLYLVRQMKAGRSTSIVDMADKFNHTEREVVRSLKYWQAQGLVSLKTDSAGTLTGIRLCEPKPRRDQRVIPITPMLENTSGTVSVQNDTPLQTNDIDFSEPEKKNTASAAPAPAVNNVEKREEMAQILFIVEQYIGKPLSATEMQTVYYICDDLHFSDDLVDYLFQYCVGIGKKDFRYIEKVAINWAESGISTSVEAQRAVSEGRKKRSSVRKTATTKSRFNNFEQNDYDFAELEKKLLEC